METLIALKGKDFVLTASSRAAVRGITILKTTDNKTRKLNKRCLLMYCGDSGDSVKFAEYIQANVQLYEKRNDLEMNPSAISAYIRSELARSVRKKPYNTNIVVAGCDTEPHLYWFDYLASCVEIPFAAQGYGQYYVLSLFDRYHRSDMSQEQGLQLMKRAITEIETRLPINMGGWHLHSVRQDGIRDHVLAQDAAEDERTAQSTAQVELTTSA